MRKLILVITASLAAAIHGSPVHGQEGPAGGGPMIAELRKREEMARRVPVTVALVDVLPAPDSVPAVILRRAHGSPRDVILLRRHATNGAHLAAAVLHLMIVRERSGDTSAVNTTYRLPTARRGPRAWQNTEQLRTQAVVARLRRVVPREVAGVGFVPATEIYLPSQAMREAARRNRSGRGL
jgi:hypothetical protein